MERFASLNTFELDDNVSSPFVLEGTSPNIHLLSKLAVSLLAAAFLVVYVNLVLTLCNLLSALSSSCFVLSAK